jgi:hypothetical protein
MKKRSEAFGAGRDLIRALQCNSLPVGTTPCDWRPEPGKLIAAGVALDGASIFSPPAQEFVRFTQTLTEASAFGNRGE